MTVGACDLPVHRARDSDSLSRMMAAAAPPGPPPGRIMVTDFDNPDPIRGGPALGAIRAEPGGNPGPPLLTCHGPSDNVT